MHLPYMLVPGGGKCEYPIDIKDKTSYQMNPANSDEAMREIAFGKRGCRFYYDKTGNAVSGYHPPDNRSV